MASNRLTSARCAVEMPRTDAERFTVRVQDSTMRWLPVEVVHASFADKLERESAALADMAKTQLAAAFEEMLLARQQNAALAAALQELVAVNNIDFEELGEAEFKAFETRYDAAMESARAALSKLRA